jgi:AsmA protein
LTPALEGAVAFEATDLGPLLALAGAAMPALPSGAGRDRIAANGQITLTDAGSVHLREGTITLDDNMLGVALDMVPGEDRPMIRGTVSGGVLSFMPSGGGGGLERGPVTGRQTRPDGLPIPSMSLACSPPTQRSRCALAG